MSKVIGPLRRQLPIHLQRQVFSMVPVQLQVEGLKQKSDRVTRKSNWIQRPLDITSGLTSEISGGRFHGRT